MDRRKCPHFLQNIYMYKKKKPENTMACPLYMMHNIQHMSYNTYTNNNRLRIHVNY